MPSGAAILLIHSRKQLAVAGNLGAILLDLKG